MTGNFLNLASGQRPFGPPFVNVDVQAKWNPHVVADILDMPMFSDESAQMIVVWHAFEHNGCGDSDQMVRECHRILHPGGKLIAAVPDLDVLAWMRLSGQMTFDTYRINMFGAYMGDEADRHKWGWNQENFLEWIAGLASWKSVVKFNGPAPSGSDITVDKWMATCEAIK